MKKELINIGKKCLRRSAFYFHATLTACTPSPPIVMKGKPKVSETFSPPASAAFPAERQKCYSLGE